MWPTPCLRLSVFCFAVIAVGTQKSADGFVSLLSDEGKSITVNVLLLHVDECGKEFEVSKDQIVSDGQAGKPNPCVVKCLLRKINVINENGLIDVKNAQYLIKKHLPKREHQEALHEMIDTCSSVNDGKANDTEGGCELAKAFFECAMPMFL